MTSAFLLTVLWLQQAAAPVDSPRFSEWVDVVEGRPGAGVWHDRVRVWTVYPERATRAPAVILVSDGAAPPHADADRLAAAGFLALVPDLRAGLVREGHEMRLEDSTRRLSAVVRWALAQPFSNNRVGVIAYAGGARHVLALGLSEPRVSAIVSSGDSGKIACPVLRDEHPSFTATLAFLREHIDPKARSAKR